VTPGPLRTCLSTLGIVMGAASLVGVLSLADGAEAFARRQIELNGLQAVIVNAGDERHHRWRLDSPQPLPALRDR